MTWLGHSLLDTPEERQQLLQKQDESLQQSIGIDRREEGEKKELLIQQDQERVLPIEELTFFSQSNTENT